MIPHPVADAGDAPVAVELAERFGRNTGEGRGGEGEPDQVGPASGLPLVDQPAPFVHQRFQVGRQFDAVQPVFRVAEEGGGFEVDVILADRPFAPGDEFRVRRQQIKGVGQQFDPGLKSKTLNAKCDEHFVRCTQL